MNRAIVKLFGFVLVLYGVLLFFTSYWSVFDAKGLRDNIANRRPLLEQERVHRGSILTADGQEIAVSNPQGEGKRKVYLRDYPKGALYGNPVGYSFIDRGQVGLEKSHNDELAGNRSEFLSVLDQLEGHGRDGDNLVTSIDSNAQQVALDGLSGRCGAVVAMEPSTGKIRTMVSVPTYDPNQVRDSSTFQQLNKDPLAPLFNRATQSGYPPGSTFKVVTDVAAIDSGKFKPSSVLSGKSPIKISGKPLTNFGNEQFGDIDLTTALTNSVNTVWAQVGEQLGKKTLFKYMNRFGFDQSPNLDLPSDQLRPSGVYAGRQVLGAGDPVDVGRVAIGQERLEVTPLQMAEVAAAVGNGGVLERPRLWDHVVDPDGRTVKRVKSHKQSKVMSEDTAKTVGQMMASVVKEGTGTAAALSGVDVAGKTGTAQVGPSPCGNQANQAWFIGFAPVDDPKVAVAVTVERSDGQGGTIAAPIAARVMESLLQ